MKRAHVFPRGNEPEFHDKPEWDPALLRSYARSIFEDDLRDWGQCYVLHGLTTGNGQPLPTRISYESRGCREVVEIDLNALRRTVAPEHVEQVEVLIKLLRREARTARAAVPVAQFELEQQAGRVDAANKGGRATAKKIRPQVEELIRAALRRGENPSEYIAAWAEEYGYTTRQLRNIVNRVRGESP